MGRRQLNVPFLLVIVAVFGVFVWLVCQVGYWFSPGYRSHQVVEEFYTHEQDSHYSESWELLHPLMKERWGKGTWMQDRAHVFNNHFGAETFDFTIEKVDKVKGWRMEQESRRFEVAYQFHVEQTYSGKYGTFAFLQEVYVVKGKKDWKVLWDYK
ncbi:hypothetical protein [Alteribacillus sp. HJP-4]|uniref:hypothetical protein n=1 Tax=Alteribacillus sp. HJP-4 TaxID=2775394 RepID=UPI0035CCC939